MAQVPSNLIPTRVSALPVDPSPSSDGTVMYNREGTTYQVRVSDLLATAQVPAARLVNAGNGLDGGGSLASDVTLGIKPQGVTSEELANTGVVAGTYGTSTSVPVIAVGADGRVTSASNLVAQLNLNQAINTLSLAHGGTNATLTAVAGGVVYSDSSRLQITTAGRSGELLSSNGSGSPTWINPASVYGLTASVDAAATSAVEAAGYANAASAAAVTASGAIAYSDLAKDWATKTSSEVVTGEGYGAKKYALDANTSAISALASKDAAAQSANDASLAAISAANATNDALVIYGSISAVNAAASTATSKAAAALLSAADALNSQTLAAVSATNAAQSVSESSTNADIAHASALAAAEQAELSRAAATQAGIAAASASTFTIPLTQMATNLINTQTIVVQHHAFL